MFRKKKTLNEKRFLWRSKNPYIKAIEKKLLKQAFGNLHGNKVLEVGSGEGANLFHLKKYFNDLTGVDISEDKLQLAKEKLPQVNFLNCTAEKLPFLDEVFDTVFMRDVLHHITCFENKTAALKEMKRVCQKGGKIVIIEPNISNIINFFQMLFQKEERGMRESTVKNIKKLLSDSNINTFEIEYLEPLPIDRLVLHYQFGLPWLGYVPFMRFFLRLLNFLYKIIIPKKLWSYIIFKVEL